MSAGQGIGSVIGATIGFITGGPAGALKGAYWGYMAGTLVDPPPGPHTYGPRLNDKVIQTSEDGAPLPTVFGTVRLSGNVIWSSGLEEIASETEAGGGSGGGGATSTTYRYRTDAAIALCAGEITGVRRIWADTKLIYDASETASLETLLASSQKFDNIRVYTGSSTQQPDPLIQAIEGASSTPAFREIAYVVFENLELADFGNRLPNFSFEITRGAQSGVSTLLISDEVPPLYNMIVSIKYKSGERTKVITMGAPQAWNGTSYPQKLDYWYVDTSGKWENYFSTYLHYLGNYNWSVVGFSDVAEYEDDTFVLGYMASTSYSFLVTLTNDALVIKKLHGGSLSTYHNYITRDYIAYTTANPAGFNISERAKLQAATVTLGTWGGCPGYGLSEIPDFYEAGHYARLELTGEMYRGRILIAENHIYALTNSSPCKIWRINKAQVLAAGGLWTTASVEYVVYDYGLNLKTVINTGYEENSLLIHSGTTLIKTLDFVNWETLGTVLYAASHKRSTIQQINSNLYAVNDSTHLAIVSHRLFTQSTETLQAVCTALSAAAGLEPGEYDYSPLAADNVRGYILSRPLSMRAALEPLQTAWQWDISEVDGQLKAVKRGGAIAATLTENDLGAAETPSSITLQMIRNNESELPSEIQVSYSDLDNDYQAGTQYARSLTLPHSNLRQISLPLVLTSTEAAKLADTLLGVARWSGAHDLAWSCTYQHARLAPGDVVSVPGYGRTWRARIEQIDMGQPGLVQIRAVPDIGAIYSSQAVGADAAGIGQTLALSGDTDLAMLDCCILRDTDTSLGWYVALSSPALGWRGGALFRSSDGGATWTHSTSATSNMATTYGRAGTLLADADCRVWDKASALTVNLSRGTLSSATETAVLDGANAALIGAHGRWELIQFQTATENLDGSWTLSNLLRGRKGTEWAAALHTSSDRVIFPSANTLTQSALTSSDLAAARLYRAVTAGQSLESVTAESHSYSGERLKPLAPVYVAANAQPNKNILITWQRRDRIAKSFHASSLPQSEASESWQIDIIYNGVVARTLTSTTTSCTYTAADVAVDTGGAALTATVRVYQISALLGRGRAGSTTVAVPGLSITPQISTITLSGTFAVGEAWSAVISPTTLGGVLSGARTAIAGDTNLSGVATAWASAITAGLGSLASKTTVVAAGQVITITAQYPFNLAGYLNTTGIIYYYSTLIQAPSPIKAGANEIRALLLTNPSGAGSWGPGLHVGKTFTVGIRQGSNAPIQYVSATSISDNYMAGILVPLYAALLASSAFAAMGLTFSLNYSTSGADAGYPNYITISSNVQSPNPFQTTLSSNDASAALYESILQVGVSAIPAALPQISRVLIHATTFTTGAVYSIKINTTTYSYTVVGGDTAAVIGAALLAAINADGPMPVTASVYQNDSLAYGINLTADAANTPFTLSTTASKGGAFAIATTQAYSAS